MINAPKRIALHKQSQQLELAFAQQTYQLSAEYLRVHSPSAEVQGHGPGQKDLPLDKQSVKITAIEPQGNYAIRLIFDDGHDSGIYTWQYLYELSVNEVKNWEIYRQEAEEKRLNLAGESVLKWAP